MFPFWETAIAPVIEASAATRVVEIGALRGETTALMLDRLGPGVELHVVDPVPEFDPTEHEKRFPGRYIFHRDISHNVLPRLPAVDVALIDGDHNWYTAYHELRMLSATAREAGKPLPVLVMHDVGWPYGHRDLYYAPERIPEEFRQPYDQRGMQPGRRELLPPGRGGLSPTMNNAVQEGGPRNGVMTALEDFMREHDRPLRRVVLPLYFGLAIVVEEERLAHQPELARVLDRLESAEGRRELLELGESLRIRALIFQHGVFYGSQARFEKSAERYLNLLKAALLDEHYLENEVRLAYLSECASSGREPDPSKLQDPFRNLRKEYARLRDGRRAGSTEPDAPPFFPYTTMGRHRLEHLERCLETIRTEAVDGDLVECGTGRGGGAIFMRGFLDAYEMLGRRVWVADPFRGLSDPGADPEAGSGASSPRSRHGSGDLNIVRDGFQRFELLDDRVRFLQGSFCETLPDAPIEKLAFLRVDTASYEATLDILDALYGRLAVGGFVMIDDYGTAECRRAVEEFRARHGIEEQIERVDWAGASWRKLAAVTATPRSASDHRARAPLTTPLSATRKGLSVVVVFYNMRREAERTLHSLTRTYQQGIEDLDYEVIVVENGSVEEEKLDEAFVRTFGPEFRYLDLGEKATPSPANALNCGIASANGEAIALMIDGAHVLTPGVLRFGMLGLEAYGPAMVATQQWYVGPGQQPDTMMHGYDQEYEDRLFDEIEWPNDGYRLFDIGHFVGERDWFDGLWESNCIFAPRNLLEQVGGMDETFSMAGGGYANLDFYERIGATPDVTVVSILGEGTFHQAHGGTTTNESDPEERRQRLGSYDRHYRDLRGRVFRGPGKPIHFVGSMFESARRTKPRRQIAPAFFKRAQRTGPDGRPEKPVPIPDELKGEFTDAFWRSYSWRETLWLGRRVPKCPTDLLAYQEIIVRAQPDWIVETNTGGGGRALFLASICELLGRGQVLSIDSQAAPRVPEHPRITYLAADPGDDATVEKVRDLVGEPPNAVVILGLAPKKRLLTLFSCYEPLVPVGSYLVFEETITNGNPVWPGMGPGPMEAIKDIRKTNGEFMPDPEMENSGLTFNPGGFLKRMA